MSVWHVGVAMLLLVGGSQAQTPDDQRVRAFVAAAASRLTPGEAMEALQAGPAEEYYRWGKEICGELEKGTKDEMIIGNLAEFFGHDLAAALVGASRAVICRRAG